MKFEFDCSQCKQRLRIPEAAQGQQVQCPECGHIQAWPANNPCKESEPPAAADTKNPFRDDGNPYFTSTEHDFDPTKTNPYAAPLSSAASLGLNFADQRRLASRGARLAGAVLDWAAFLGAMLPGAICLAYADQQADEPLHVLGTLLLATGIGVITIVFWAMAVMAGQSPAKRLLGTRVELTSGGKPGFIRGVLVRQWCMFLACLCCPFGPFVYLFDGLTVFGEKRQCVHDILAATIVVNVNRPGVDPESKWSALSGDESNRGGAG
jgi:uncharacterized RDD family membrane protein YckC